RIERRFFWALTALFTRATGYVSCQSSGDERGVPGWIGRRGSEPEHARDARSVGIGDDGLAVEATRHPRGLVLEQVAATRLLAQDLSATGHLESLRGAAVGLRIGHGVLSSCRVRTSVLTDSTGCAA